MDIALFLTFLVGCFTETRSPVKHKLVELYIGRSKRYSNIHASRASQWREVPGECFSSRQNGCPADRGGSLEASLVAKIIRAILYRHQLLAVHMTCLLHIK